jgi:hypothetical protein
MQDFIAAITNPGSLDQVQWMALAIMLFVVVASFYFVLRLFRIFKNAGKSSYKPNIGLSRTGYMHAKRGGKPQSEDQEV